MQLKERILELESSDAFLEWKKINKDSYLAHIFFDESGHQFGYYNTDDTVTSFTFRDGTVNHDAGQKIFKANADPLVRLDVSRVEKGFPDCIQKAKDYLAKKYPSQSALKFFAILQEIKKKAVFNITLFTQSLHALHVHIDATSGEILDEQLISLFSVADIQKKLKERR